jgi:CheY-like chemotaxis protein
MNMPEMDGIETLRHLRAMGGGAGCVPVIAMTADATEDHRRNYLKAGLDGYVAKPLTPDRLSDALRPHLGTTALLPFDQSTKDVG